MPKLNNTYDDTPANTENDIPSPLKTSPLIPSPLIPAILNADPMLATDVKKLADADEERDLDQDLFSRKNRRDQRTARPGGKSRRQ